MLIAPSTADNMRLPKACNMNENHTLGQRPSASTGPLSAIDAASSQRGIHRNRFRMNPKESLLLQTIAGSRSITDQGPGESARRREKLVYRSRRADSPKFGTGSDSWSDSIPGKFPGIQRIFTVGNPTDTAWRQAHPKSSGSEEITSQIGNL